jgi:predicted acylesterase/phospholipase RssA
MKAFEGNPIVRRRPASPSVAIALGSGGARGLAHIVALEADVLLRPGVDRFNVLEFMRAAQILGAAESLKDELKRGLVDRMEALRRM